MGSNLSCETHMENAIIANYSEYIIQLRRLRCNLDEDMPLWFMPLLITLHIGSKIFVPEKTDCLLLVTPFASLDEISHL